MIVSNQYNQQLVHQLQNNQITQIIVQLIIQQKPDSGSIAPPANKTNQCFNRTSNQRKQSVDQTYLQPTTQISASIVPPTNQNKSVDQLYLQPTKQISASIVPPTNITNQ